MASVTPSPRCRASESYILHPPSPKSSPFPEPCRHDSDPSGSPGIKVSTYVSCLPAVPDLEFKERPAQDTLCEKAHYKIQKLRMRVTEERHQLRQQRMALRQQRQKTLDYEVSYYDALDRSWSKRRNVEDANLDGLHDLLHEARDKLGPMEEDYSETGADLDELEYRLEVQEEQFYTQSGRLRSIGSPPISSCNSLPGMTQQDSMSHSAAEDSPTTRYFSRLGDADILRERLEDLVEEQREFAEQEEVRRSYSLLPYAPNVASMANFSLLYTELVEELRQVEKHAKVLKDEAGIADSVSAPMMPSSPVSIQEGPRVLFEGTEDKSNSVPTILHPANSTHVLQNVIPSIPSHTSITTCSNTELAQVMADKEQRRNRTTLERISQWMLTQLGSSKIEQWRHKSFLDDIFLDDGEWWAHVEQFWPLDQAGGTLRPSPQGNSWVSR